MARSSIKVVLVLSFFQFFQRSISLGLTPQSDFNFPVSPDNTTVVSNGQAITISWDADLWRWFSTYAPDCDVAAADLWVCGFEQHQFEHLVAASVNVNGTSTNRRVTWKVQIPTQELSSTDYWVFRFVKFGANPLSTLNTVSSAGFFITDPSVPSSTSNLTTASPSSSTTRSSTATVSSSAAGQSSSASNSPTDGVKSPHSQTLGGVVIAGVAIGAVAGVALLVAAIWMMMRRARTNKTKLATSLEHDAIRADDKNYPIVFSSDEKVNLATMQEIDSHYGSHYPNTSDNQLRAAELEHVQNIQMPAELNGSYGYRR